MSTRLQMDLDPATDRLRERVVALESALRPFAVFAKAYLPVATSLDYSGDQILGLIHTHEGPVAVTLDDYSAALKAFGGGGMSQRMTEEAWSDLVSQVGLGRRGEHLLNEAERARSEEARLLEDTIQALADALERRCAEHRKGCECGGCAALRLTGR